MQRGARAADNKALAHAMRAAGKAYLASFYLRNGQERDTTTTSNDKTTPPRLCTSRAWAAGARPVGLARAVPFHFHPLDSIGAIELVDRYGVRSSSRQRSTVCYCTPLTQLLCGVHPWLYTGDTNIFSMLLQVYIRAYGRRRPEFHMNDREILPTRFSY